MEAKRFVVMGAGDVGSYLARALSSDGHVVTIIDLDDRSDISVRELSRRGLHQPTDI